MGFVISANSRDLLLLPNRIVKHMPIPCSLQEIKTFSKREGWLNIGIKGDGGIKSKGTRI